MLRSEFFKKADAIYSDLRNLLADDNLIISQAGNAFDSQLVIIKLIGDINSASKSSTDLLAKSTLTPAEIQQLHDIMSKMMPQCPKLTSQIKSHVANGYVHLELLDSIYERLDKISKSLDELRTKKLSSDLEKYIEEATLTIKKLYSDKYSPVMSEWADKVNKYNQDQILLDTKLIPECQNDARVLITSYKLLVNAIARAGLTKTDQPIDVDKLLNRQPIQQAKAPAAAPQQPVSVAKVPSTHFALNAVNSAVEAPVVAAKTEIKRDLSKSPAAQQSASVATVQSTQFAIPLLKDKAVNGKDGGVAVAEESKRESSNRKTNRTSPAR